MSRDPDSVAISVVVLLTTMPVVIATVLSCHAFSGGATICLALSALGIVGLVGDHGDSTPLPRARVRPKKR